MPNKRFIVRVDALRGGSIVNIKTMKYEAESLDVFLDRSDLDLFTVGDLKPLHDDTNMRVSITSEEI